MVLTGTHRYGWADTWWGSASVVSLECVFLKDLAALVSITFPGPCHGTLTSIVSALTSPTPSASLHDPLLATPDLAPRVASCLPNNYGPALAQQTRETSYHLVSCKLDLLQWGLNLSLGKGAKSVFGQVFSLSSPTIFSYFISYSYSFVIGISKLFL